MTKKGLLLGMFLFGMLFLVSCAAGPNPVVNATAADGSLAGFWLGLWHGIISPITFIISLFSDKVHFYEVYNNGNWYNFGFALGAATILFGGSKKASSD